MSDETNKKLDKIIELLVALIDISVINTSLSPPVDYPQDYRDALLSTLKKITDETREIYNS